MVWVADSSFIKNFQLILVYDHNRISSNLWNSPTYAYAFWTTYVCEAVFSALPSVKPNYWSTPKCKDALPQGILTFQVFNSLCKNKEGYFI